MNHPNSQQLFVGLPGSGKTTFLAALWHSLRDSSNTSSLSIHTLPAERDYLNGISDEWAQGESQVHTKSGSVIEIVLDLKCAKTDERATLSVPDVSGEIYRQGWADREWSKSFHSLASGANGILLFLHPNSVGASTTIADVADATSTLREERVDTSTDTKAPRALSFNALRSASEVILVDQLQCLIDEPCFHSHLTVAVIISAWDEVTHEDKQPSAWLNAHALFLSQFLDGNRDRLNLKVFGVSAQGCDYDETNETNAILKDFNNPGDRIRVVTDDSETHDISAPIQWIIDNAHDEKVTTS